MFSPTPNVKKEKDNDAPFLAKTIRNARFSYIKQKKRKRKRKNASYAYIKKCLQKWKY